MKKHIDDSFDDFLASDAYKGVEITAQQRHEMRKVFFAGAASLYATMCMAVYLPDRAAERICKQIDTELKAFGKEAQTEGDEMN